uniref:Ovule protein n=1 Tax=Meloidogyne incognita TaxID=6306 RepID=A0A914MHG5_MELIC
MLHSFDIRPQLLQNIDRQTNDPSRLMLTWLQSKIFLEFKIFDPLFHTFSNHKGLNNTPFLDKNVQSFKLLYFT